MEDTKPAYQDLLAEIKELKKVNEELQFSMNSDKLLDTLNASESKFRQFSENSQVIFYTLNTEGIITFVSPVWTSLLGHQVSEVQGCSFISFVHPEDISSIMFWMKNLLESGKFHECIEYRIKHKNGNYEWHTSLASAQFDSGGHAIGFNGTARDISTQKKAQLELQLKKEEIDKFFETSLDLLCIANQKGQFVRLNKEWTSTIGYSIEELENRSFLDFVHPDDIESTLAVMSTLESGKEVLNFTNRYLCKDGLYRFIEWRSKPQGELIYASARDITERKKTEDALQQSLDFNSSLLKTIPYGMHIVDETGTILFQSEVMKDIINKEVTGKKCWQLYRDDECQSPSCPLLTGIEIGKTSKHESSGLIGGRTYEISHTGMLFQGKKAILEIFLDITERKMHDLEIAAFNEELRASTDALCESNQILEEAKDRAEESDRLKSAFLANVSHEIRTPMNGILGFASLLKQPKLSGEDQKKYIGIIEKSGERMLNIINDLINISKVESGQMEVLFSETNINNQLDFLFNLFQNEAGQKGIELLMTCQLPTEKAIINTDREKVYAILTNLIKNAIKFTKKGRIEFGYYLLGPISVDGERRKAYGIEAEQAVELEFFVKDTGIGIPESQHKIIFDRFAQADSELSNGYEGAGLGLSISKAYVEMLGGQISVKSEKGKGSEFYFTIPMNTTTYAKESQTCDTGTEEFKSINKGITILIAEDDEDSLMYLTIILESGNFNLLLAKNGEEAVEICRNHPEIDLVLMDIKMPIMDGHAAAKSIKSFRSALPIIAQTAYALETEKEKYRETFDDYVTKPIKAEELKSKIKKHTKT